MNTKVNLDFTTISKALKSFELPHVDQVVGIATGGILPAALLAHQLGLPMSLRYINYRAADNTPQRPEPQLLQEVPSLPDEAVILLVDDVSVSGQTMALARNMLKHHKVVTFALKGKADLVLFPDIQDCVNWPWK